MMLWCDGALRHASEVRIAPDDRGFTLGDGVFETVRVHDGRLMHVHRHLHRLRGGADLLGIPIGPDQAIHQALQQTRRGNDLADGSLRLTLSRGPAPRGIATPTAMRPTMLVAMTAAAPAPPPAMMIVAESTRRNEMSPLSRIKSLNYLDSILARREAEQQGADDALLLNTQGRVAEGTAANLIALLDGSLLTPPVEDGALPGIARGLLIERGLLTIMPITRQRLHEAGTLLLCSSLGIRAVASLDRRELRLRPDLVQSLSEVLLSLERP